MLKVSNDNTYEKETMWFLPHSVPIIISQLFFSDPSSFASRFSVYCNTALNWLRSTTWVPFLLPTQITALLAGGRCRLSGATRAWTAWGKGSRFKLCVHVITDWVHCWQYPGHVAPYMLIHWTWHQNLHLTCAAHIMHLGQDFQAPKGSAGTLADFLMPPPMDLPGATVFICHT